MMTTRVVRIGNSQGVRIPKPLLEEAGLVGEVEMFVENDALVIRRARKPREGWAEAFAEMARRGDDALLDDPTQTPSRWDEEEWQWE
jgi:antitoxin MazE